MYETEIQGPGDKARAAEDVDGPVGPICLSFASNTYQPIYYCVIDSDHPCCKQDFTIVRHIHGWYSTPETELPGRYMNFLRGDMMVDDASYGTQDLEKYRTWEYTLVCLGYDKGEAEATVEYLFTEWIKKKRDDNKHMVRETRTVP